MFGFSHGTMCSTFVSPAPTNGLVDWFSSSQLNTLTKTYNNLTPTVSGSSGGTTLTTSADCTAQIQANQKFKVNGADVYTCSSINSTTITTVETLSATYSAGTSIATDSASSWTDKALQDNAAQATNANKPHYNVSAQNSLSALLFDGVASRMDFTGTTLAADFSIIAVLNSRDTASNRFFLSEKTSQSQKLGHNSSGKLFVRVVNGGSSDVSQNFPAGVNVINISRDSSNIVSYGLNGAAFTNLFSGVAQSGNCLFNRLGNDNSGFFHKGYIHELFIWNRKLSSGERTAVETTYLKAKWGTP